jgi:hypothetical protein
VEYQVHTTAPDAGSVLRFAVPLAWKSKWLIAAAVILAAVVTYALIGPSPIEVWSGRAIVTIGQAPASDFIAQKSGPAIVPIESPRRTIARLSEPAFRELVIGRATFEPATASISRSMVASSLRGILLDRERDIAIDLTAGSAADVKAAFRAVAAELSTIHAAVLDRQLKVLQNRIDQDNARLAAVAKEIGELNDQIIKSMPPPKWDEAPRTPVAPVMVTTIWAWNELQSQIRSDTTLKQLSEPTVLRIEDDQLDVSHRSIERLRDSLLAGAGMLIAMIVLTIVVSPPKRGDGRFG